MDFIEQFKTTEDKPFKVDLSKVDTSLEANAKVEEPIKVDLTKTEDNAIPIGETEAVDVGERAGDGEKVDTGGDKSNEESSSPIEEIQEMAEESIPAEQTIIDEVSPNTSHLPENIEKLVEFMNETGGTVQDYVRLNADYSDVSEDALLKEY